MTGSSQIAIATGESPGGIALWEDRSGVLFSGDLVYDGPLIEDTYHCDAAHYLASMKRLLDVPVRIVHTGHFPSYDGERHRTLIRRWLDEKEAGRTRGPEAVNRLSPP